MRLTKKKIISSQNVAYEIITSFEDSRGTCITTELIAIHKLGQLEDIEEELGIDLITLFKALDIGFAYMFVKNDYNENYKKGLVKPLIVSNFYKYGKDYKLVLCDTLTCLNYYVSVKDYGNTWALTKEELE